MQPASQVAHQMPSATGA
jgi:hypothetical protein